jgi:hypothetical protein
MKYGMVFSSFSKGLSAPQTFLQLSVAPPTSGCLVTHAITWGDSNVDAG